MQTVKSLWSSLYEIDSSKTKYLLIIFAVYAILLALIVSKHEPWMDEAQPWLMAADFSISDLFVKYLRYDGHPSLWYLILFPAAKLGLPYFTINVLSALIAMLGVWLFLRYSPFSLIIKILFPFTYFTFYQYAVVARSYCLIPPVLFSTAIIYKKRIEHPYLFIAALCLLANISALTFLMAGMILFVHLLGILKNWRQLDQKSKFRQVTSVLVFGLISIQLVLLLAPPEDQIFASGANLSLIHFFEISQKMFMGSLVADETKIVTWLHSVFTVVILFFTVLFLRQKQLTPLYLLPLLTILGFLSVKYGNVWHQGILFLLWIFVLWVSFDKTENEKPTNTGKFVLLVMTIVLLIQINWSVHAAYNDYYRSYSGSFDVAEYIKSNQLENKKIFISGWKTLALQPYFDNNIFYNYNNGSNLRIWLWSTENQTEIGIDSEIINKIQVDQPDVVIFASDHIELENPPIIDGYEFVDLFEGNLFWKTGVYEQNSYWIYLKTNSFRN